MECNYDENLDENTFLICLRNEYEDIFRKAVYDNWIICVPCSESLSNYELNEFNVFTHILVPSDELPETHFHTVNNQEVRIHNKSVKLKQFSQSVPILFTETFYIDNHRYEVLCIERPLNFSNENSHPNLGIYSVSNFRDCIDLLLTENSNGFLLIEKLDEIIKQFLFLSTKDYFSKSLEQQVHFIKSIYERCLQITLQDSNINKKTKLSRTFLGNVKVSVESYVLHNMYSIVMKGTVTNVTAELQIFNKIVRNLTNIQLKHIDVSDSIFECISKARSELSRLNNCNTILGKLNCLKKCINLISKKNNQRNDQLSVDEFLPVFVFLIVKSGINTWPAQLKYLQQFCFSQMDYNCGNEWNFLTSTLEAALTFIESGFIYKIIHSGCNDISLGDTVNEIKNHNDISSYVCNKSRLFWKTKNPYLLPIFKAIYNDNLEEVKILLKKYETITKIDVVIESKYCHPLCSCDKCEKLHADNMQQPLTIHSVNDTGCSLLHVAACFGRSSILDWLLNEGVNTNCSDYFGSVPLHCAAAHGHQNVLLLLMYAGAKLDEKDDDGNLALHFASANGHLDCVKALLYFAEHANIRLNVNEINKDGDTPLHLAVKYYQIDVVEILLLYNATPSLKNKHGNNAFELTESLSIHAVLNEKHCSIVNLLNTLSDSTSFVQKIEELSLNDDTCFLSKEEYGVRPQSAECIKNTDKLLIAVKENDLSLVKQYLGFSGTNEVHRDRSGVNSCSTYLSTYTCHPLCRCEKCTEDTSLENENQDDFDKINALSANICNSEGFTALHIASKFGRVEILRFLLDIGVKVNVRTFKQRSTPLHIACMWSQLNAVKILIEHNSCKINLIDRNGNTPLHLACVAGNAHIVEVLLKCEPDLSIRNFKGKTALNEAEENLSFSVIRLFRSTSWNSKFFDFIEFPDL